MAQESARPTAGKSSCTTLTGNLELRSREASGAFRCFAFDVSGGRASIFATDLNGKDIDTLTVLFPATVGNFRCSSNSKKVLVDFVHRTTGWKAYWYRGWAFGDCALTTNSIGEDHWSGAFTAQLVIVKGNTETGSPSRLHTLKDETGKPITLEVDFSGFLQK
ncbi:MAG: hypothetical protein ABSG54_00630 [Terriglobia bacterium]|jgi:hypothetical protein